MKDVEKQIEEVMDLVDKAMAAYFDLGKSKTPLELNDAHRRAADAKRKLRTLLSSAQSGEQVPFGYVNTNTGQFFKDVEPCRKNNEGHWRTVYAAPAPEMEVERDQNYQLGFKDGYGQRDAEIKGALV